jgi:hypothetical protein
MYIIPQRKYNTPHYKDEWLMLFKEITRVYFENDTKPTNPLWENSKLCTILKQVVHIFTTEYQRFLYTESHEIDLRLFRYTVTTVSARHVCIYCSYCFSPSHLGILKLLSQPVTFLYTTATVSVRHISVYYSYCSSRHISVYCSYCFSPSYFGTAYCNYCFSPSHDIVLTSTVFPGSCSARRYAAVGTGPRVFVSQPGPTP